MECILRIFEGKGCSDGFTVNMQKMLEFFFEKGADIRLTVSGDEICKECPNLKRKLRECPVWWKPMTVKCT